MMRRRRTSKLRTLALLTVGGLVAASVVQELRKPPAQRTWHGAVLGVVPYDYRPPTIERFRSTLWAPDDEQLLKPRAFGLGWDVNVGRLARLASQRRARLVHQ